MIGKQARVLIMVLLGVYMSLLMFSHIEKSRRYKDIIKQSELRDQERVKQNELWDIEYAKQKLAIKEYEIDIKRASESESERARTIQKQSDITYEKLKEELYQNYDKAQSYAEKVVMKREYDKKFDALMDKRDDDLYESSRLKDKQYEEFKEKYEARIVEINNRMNEITNQ